jgi:rfaE bifunctional protein kinase chain/domain
MTVIVEKSIKKVFVSGNFFVLHPGHIRLLKFASECGDRLYVGINDTRPSVDYPSAEERMHSLRELGFVYHVEVLDKGLKDFIKDLKPELVIKGKEFEAAINPEDSWIKEWGGKLLFASGDAMYSGDFFLLDSETRASSIWRQPKKYITRHNCFRDTLLPFLEKFQKLHIAVVGDLILDEYIQCEALGMSREDPTLVVSPQITKRFMGGAGIVSAHCRSLGAEVKFFSVIGDDENSQWTESKLYEYGVETALVADSSRPTTLKQRYRVNSKTMLRVSHLRQHEIDLDAQNTIFEKVKSEINKFDLLILSDFNYGVLPQNLVNALIHLAKLNNVYVAADSQSSSQIGDITRFSQSHLVTPTEYEARLSLKDQTSGLHIIAQKMIKQCDTEAAIITLGEAGALVIDKQLGIDQLPSLNPNPVDISGAGDSMLVASAIALTLKASPFQSAYMGAIAAAIQVGRIGNTPISMSDFKKSLI